MDIKQALARVVERIDLNTAEMQDVMKAIMSGQCSDAQIAALLVALRMKGESIDEIEGAARVMRDLATPVHISQTQYLVDIVGTGGDGANLFHVPRRRQWSLRRPVVAWRSTATAPYRRRAVVPTCWKLLGLISRLARKKSHAASTPWVSVSSLP